MEYSTVYIGIKGYDRHPSFVVSSMDKARDEISKEWGRLEPDGFARREYNYNFERYLVGNWKIYKETAY